MKVIFNQNRKFGGKIYYKSPNGQEFPDKLSKEDKAYFDVCAAKGDISVVIVPDAAPKVAPAKPAPAAPAPAGK